MALIPDSTTGDDNFSKRGIKVEGDLGELQIVETTDSECSDDESSLAIDQRSGANQTLSNILPNVVQEVQAPVLSNVAVNNSENVQFGNNTYFHGPVTIKQIIRKKGIENASYTTSDNDNEHSSTNSFRDKPKLVEISSKKFNIPPWGKVILSVASVFTLCIICILALYIQSHRQDDPPSNIDSNASVKETSKWSQNNVKTSMVCINLQSKNL